jgi:hypothetical protein
MKPIAPSTKAASIKAASPQWASAKAELDQARRAIDGALTRDRGRLHGLWSRWSAKPADPAAQAGFAQALQASVAVREARARVLPQVAVDADLPIAVAADRIVELIRAHQVVVIAGETGSGKTTQLPKLCLAAGRGAAGMIGCTQPRRIAARAVARRVAEELQVPIGGMVGYQVRFNDNVGVDTAIKFMTDGILLAEIQSDRWLRHPDHRRGTRAQPQYRFFARLPQAAVAEAARPEGHCYFGHHRYRTLLAALRWCAGGRCRRARPSRRCAISAVGGSGVGSHGVESHGVGVIAQRRTCKLPTYASGK